MIKQNYIEVSEKRICIVEVIPENRCEGKIMFISGYGQNKCGYFCMNMRMAKYLCDNGYHCILYDHVGVGDSEGDLQQYSWNDYKEISIQISERYMSGSSMIHYLGVGVGANLAILLSKLNDAKVIGISNWLSRYPSPSEMGLGLLEKIEFSKLYERAFTSNYLRILGGNKHHTSGFYANPMFFEQLSQEKNFYELSDGQRIMLVYGEHDFSCKVREQSLKLYKIKERGAHVVVVKGADRFFSFADWQDQMFEEILAWLLLNK